MKIMELITLYSPILVTVFGNVSTFFVLLKKIKSVSFKDDMKALTDKFKGQDERLQQVLDANKALREDNRKLKEQLSLLIDNVFKVKDYEEKRNEK